MISNCMEISLESRSFPIGPKPLFQSEAKCKAIDLKI